VVKDLLLGTLAVLLGLMVVQSGGTSLAIMFGWVFAGSGLLLIGAAVAFGRSRG
jgi:hypothetical protein